jgi:hypothetical protein
MSPRFTPEARAANLALVDLLKRIAERKHATPAKTGARGSKTSSYAAASRSA